MVPTKQRNRQAASAAHRPQPKYRTRQATRYTAHRPRNTSRSAASARGTRRGSPPRGASIGARLYQRAYAWVDRLTGGRAAQVRKITAYLMAGGLSAAVNLAVQALVLYRVTLSMNEGLHNLIALVVATEISILVNFAMNDRFTFQSVGGYTRPWRVRCLRFHLTALSGVLLTMLIQIVLHEALRIQPVLANAIAIVIVLNYNYAIHHLFTYRQAAAH